jgi:RND superfamily putative drug exporter
MYELLGRTVSRHWIATLLGWAVLIVAIHQWTPNWDDVTCDGDFAYLPQQMSSVQGERLLQEAFPEGLSKSQVIFVLARRDGPLQPADYAIADQLVEQCDAMKGGDNPILSILSHQSEVVGEKLKSPVGPDGQALLVMLQLDTEFMAIRNMPFLADVYATLDKTRNQKDFPAGLTIGVTGSAAIGTDMLFSGEESIRNTERTTVLLVIIILLLVYRSPGLTVVPLATIFVSLAVSMGIVAEVTKLSADYGWFDFKIFKTTRIFVVVILFGAGTDFCLFLISRYREELERGLSPPEAVTRALGRVGGAIAASAMTTILGLGCMAFADFGKFRNSGPAIAMCLVVALLASLTVAPALLRGAGTAVFWPFGIRLRTPSQLASDDDGSHSLFRGFWEWLSHRVVRHPGAILVVSLILLSPLVYHGLGVEVTYDLLSELQPNRPSVGGTELLRRYYPAGETGPVTVLIRSEQGGYDGSEAFREKLRRLSQQLYRLEFDETNGKTVHPITSVRSLVEPLGEAQQSYGVVGAIRAGIIRGHQRTKSTYLAHPPELEGKVTRLDLITRYDPFSLESILLLDELEGYFRDLKAQPNSDWEGAEFCFAGTTAVIRDLRSVTSSDLLRIQQLVPMAVLFVLFVILRRPLVSIYLILSVLLGYFVSIGTTSLFFQWFYGATFHGLDWKVPMYLFVILIAVGEDYNIYLATRIYEEQRRRGPIEGLRVALVRTGGIITSCGVIMAGTFASMMTGTLRTVMELGVALSFGVMLDTFVIRTILVPAFLVLWEGLWAKTKSPASLQCQPDTDSKRP